MKCNIYQLALLCIVSVLLVSTRADCEDEVEKKATEYIGKVDELEKIMVAIIDGKDPNDRKKLTFDKLAEGAKEWEKLPENVRDKAYEISRAQALLGDFAFVPIALHADKLSSEEQKKDFLDKFVSNTKMFYQSYTKWIGPVGDQEKLAVPEYEKVIAAVSSKGGANLTKKNFENAAQELVEAEKNWRDIVSGKEYIYDKIEELKQILNLLQNTTAYYFRYNNIGEEAKNETSTVETLIAHVKNFLDKGDIKEKPAAEKEKVE